MFKKKCFLLSLFIRIQINKIHLRCRNTMKMTTSQLEQEVMKIIVMSSDRQEGERE